jgi:FAD/FMN-containing dehydrogenase
MLGRKYQLKTSCLGHFGDGNLHIVWGTNDDLYGRELLHKAIDELNKWAISICGAVSGEHGIGAHKKQYMRIQYGTYMSYCLK